MVLLSLPFFDLGLVFFMNESENQIIKISNFHDFVSAYFMVLGYSYVLFGFLLALASGIASLYLRDQLVYHILYTDKRRSHSLPRYVGTKQVKTKSKPITKTGAIHRKKT
ncbi:MAG: hypothetical protein ACRCXC_00710 [Legionella sp.]